MNTRRLQPRFRLGKILATPGAIGAMGETGLTPGTLLKRHVCGDWGEVDDDDKRANDAAIRYGARILSAYRTAVGQRLWVITEADRSATTILLPEEY